LENKQIASVFKLVGQLMELHGENKFKVRSYSNAAFQVGKYPKPIREMAVENYESIPGIGKNLIPKLEELIQTGEMSYLNQWLEKTPDGVIEILKIKGIGPSKVRVIWQDMGIESIGELLYACHENRLVDYKGFGAKTQLQVRQSIEFMMEHADMFLYASVEPLIEEVKQLFLEQHPNMRIEETGAAFRKDPVLDKLEFVAEGDDGFLNDHESRVPIIVHEAEAESFDLIQFEESLSEEERGKISSWNGSSAEEIYAANQLPFVPGEMRNCAWGIEWASSHKEEDLVAMDRLRGCLHNHSTYSDGIHSLREMATFLKENGFEYFGISDHSKTAVYAGGLTEQEIIEQHAEIDALNKELNPFRILKGIESDILMDGSLDYADDVLASFDFIVASVHSVLKMDEETATNRLIKAVENPYTSILGHPTGRLLLSRKGYPIDHKKVIDACAANGVAVELNANPLRLDIDYTWIPYCMERDVKVSINPDAHRVEGFDHMRYGVMAARKGGLTTNMTLNAMSLNDLQKELGF